MYGHTIQFCFKDGRKPVVVKSIEDTPEPMPPAVVSLIAEILPDVDPKQVDHYHQEVIPLTPEALMSAVFGAALLAALDKDKKKDPDPSGLESTFDQLAKPSNN